VRLFCEELGARVVAKHYNDCAALVLAAVQLGLIPPMGGIASDVIPPPNSIAGLSVDSGRRALNRQSSTGSSRKSAALTEPGSVAELRIGRK